LPYFTPAPTLRGRRGGRIVRLSPFYRPPAAAAAAVSARTRREGSPAEGRACALQQARGGGRAVAGPGRGARVIAGRRAPRGAIITIPRPRRQPAWHLLLPGGH